MRQSMECPGAATSRKKTAYNVLVIAKREVVFYDAARVPRCADLDRRIVSKPQASYFLISYLSTLPFFTWLKFQAMTNGPVEVTIVVSCEFGPVLNLRGVSWVDYTKTVALTEQARSQHSSPCTPRAPGAIAIVVE